VRIRATSGALALACAGCSWTLHAGAGEAAQSVVKPDLASCTSSQLRATPGPELSPATGQSPTAVRITNDGRPCTLRGYPRVVLLDGLRQEVPFRYSHRGDQHVTAKRPTTVRLGHGGTAWLLLNKYRCDLGDVTQGTTLLLGLPHATGGPKLRLRSNWPYCGAGDPGSIIAVSPFEPTLSATTAFP
jgi:Domain of unknown function (DUF4232)